MVAALLLVGQIVVAEHDSRPAVLRMQSDHDAGGAGGRLSSTNACHFIDVLWPRQIRLRRWLGRHPDRWRNRLRLRSWLQVAEGPAGSGTIRPPRGKDAAGPCRTRGPAEGDLCNHAANDSKVRGVQAAGCGWGVVSVRWAGL